jgi:hypothetical protein
VWLTRLVSFLSPQVTATAKLALLELRQADPDGRDTVDTVRRLVETVRLHDPTRPGSGEGGGGTGSDPCVLCVVVLI